MNPSVTIRWALSLLVGLFLSLSFADDYRPVVGTAPPDGYTGAWTTWYTNGAIAIEQHLEQGIPSGSYKCWRPTGEIQYEGFYYQGLSHGIFTSWYSNGMRSAERSYLNGQPDGAHIEWDQNGRIVSGLRYKQGRITHLDYYENGTLIKTEPAPTYEQHSARVAEKTAAITNGMTRAEVEKILPAEDGGIQTPNIMRYYEGWEVMVDVPYDQTGGPWKPENRVNGPVHVYRDVFSCD